MQHTKLFSYDSKKRLREWTIEIEEGRYRTIHGIVNGTLQTTEWTTVQETNVGRSNHRNLSDQALFEAQALVKKQFEQGWRSSIKVLNSNKEYIFDCMLAQNYEDRKKGIQFPVYSQPKLDGIRLNVSDKLVSRNKKEFFSIPHLKYLIDFALEHNLILDGELYSHSYKNDFNKITSLVKKTKPTEADLKESEKNIQYWIYDVFFKEEPDLSFTERRTKLLSLLNIITPVHIVIVPSTRIESFEGLDYEYGSYLEQGYEGQMIRIDSPYDQKRSKTLLKRKEFCDAEYSIIEVGEGNGNKSGMAGYMLLKNKNGSTFRSNIKGSQEWLTHLLQNKKSLIGKSATVKYFNLTPDGVPRFPYVTSIRDFE
jgi:DNA ligase-1